MTATEDLNRLFEEARVVSCRECGAEVRATWRRAIDWVCCDRCAEKLVGAGRPAERVGTPR